jgi:hypothetical protein
MEGYKMRTEAELEAVKAQAPASLEGLCTGCAYCIGCEADSGCPQGIPIPQFMDTYNYKLLHTSGRSDPIGDRLNWHWSLNRSIAGKCTACGLCEKACTQHIGIIERLKEIAG